MAQNYILQLTKLQPLQASGEMMVACPWQLTNDFRTFQG